MANLSVLVPILMFAGIAIVVLLGIAALFKAFYFKVEQGTALIVNDTSSTPKVVFTGSLVYPIIHKKELMRISLITLEVDRRGGDGLICADNMRADISVAFYLRVNETAEDVLKVAKSIGASRASDKTAVNELFAAKFSEALKTVGKKTEFVQLFENRQDFRERIIEVIGNDLNGYVLEDVAIDYLEQTPKSSLDPTNILDAEGIRKITELTATQNVRTNELEKDEELAIKKKNVTTIEAMLELDRQQQDAEARQQREVLSIQAREEAETRKIQEEERRKSEQTHIQVVQDLAVQTENQKREVEVAEQGRQRAVAIEEEKVIRARELEIVSREREVAVEEVLAKKAVEVELKEIANVIRERTMVDKTVAVEEERINEVREISEADRAKQVQVLAAEAQAEEDQVKEVTGARAQELAAQHKATEITVLADARLAEANRDSDAKKVLAEGVKAEQAAAGLSEAEVMRAKGTAEASATTEVGMANADITKAQFQAEAAGLTDKFAAMSEMSGETRQHEEYRMALETAFKESIASITAGKEIARENAEILSIALGKAHIDIVGGEEHFFDNFAKSLSIGKAIDGLAEKSDVVQLLLAKVATMGSATNTVAASAKAPGTGSAELTTTE